MLFRIIVFLLSFAVPLGIYYLYWHLFFSKNIHNQYQKLALTIAFIFGFVISITYLIYLSQTDKGNTQGTFVPATMDEKGNIVPSYFKTD